jgi:hypothetical protein
VLNVDNVNVKFKKRIDVSGGLRKSYLLEVYELSDNTVNNFMMSNKSLPTNNEYGPWEKYGWYNSSENIEDAIRYIVLASDWGSDELKLQLDTINQILDTGRGFYGFYCKPSRKEPESVQLYVLDTLKNNLYIMDSNM